MSNDRLAFDAATEKRDTFGVAEAAVSIGTAVAAGGVKIASDIIKDRGETLRERIRQDGTTDRAWLGKPDPE
ncbi:hypothetical protein AB0H36_27890 [Kribbella sp. NPDC050820]|uniref:hypothetical protein n=1 Tax=Kribbella sp. NPDC050820 TaxID=3155408 RepID=UPI00340EDAE1